MSELLAGGWCSEGDQHYIIRHHAQYQRLREAVINQQAANAANAANGAKGGRKPREQASALRSKPVTQSVRTPPPSPAG